MTFKRCNLPFFAEALSVLLSLGFLFYTLRFMLFYNMATLPHDNLFWNLPIFNFFAERLLDGHLPLWNPFSHGGEPFTALLLQLRLLDPITVITVLVGGRFTDDTCLLFNWNRVLQNVVLSLGSYVFLRRFCEKALTKVFLPPLLLLSSFFFCSFRQDGISSLYMWTPFILFFLFRLVFDGKRGKGEWFGLGFFLGLSGQSYYFAGSWTLLLLFFAALWAFYRSQFREFFADRDTRRNFSFAIFPMALMFLPNIALWWESKELVFPLRMVPAHFKETLLKVHGLLPSEATPSSYSPGLHMNYSFIQHTGSFMKVWELIQLLSPVGNSTVSGIGLKAGWGDPSESYLFFGSVTWLIMLLGLFFGAHPLKKLWLALTAGFLLLALGPAGLLHPILFHFFPPLWFLRHTHQFTLFFAIGFFFFFILGFETLLRHPLPQTSLKLRPVALTVAYALLAGGLLWAASRLEYPVFKFPLTNFLFVLLGLIGFGGYFVRQKAGPGYALAGLVLGHVGAVLLLARQSSFPHGVYLFWAIAMPLGLSWFLSRKKKIDNHIAVGALALCGVLDCGFALRKAWPLYQSTPHLKMLLDVSTKVEPERFDLTRQAFPLYSKNFFGQQTPRYLETLYRRNFAFSAPLIFAGETLEHHPVTVEHALTHQRWNSISILKTYFDLVNSKLPPAALENMFAIKQSIFQFREAALPETDEQGMSFLLSLPETQLRYVLERGLILNRKQPEYDNKQAFFKFLNETKRPPGAPLQYRLEKFHSGFVQLETQTDRPGYLYWADGFSSGWEATVDGVSTPVDRANFNFKAIRLPAGNHHVEFNFRPKFLLASIGAFYLPFLFPLLYLALLPFAFLGRRAEELPA